MRDIGVIESFIKRIKQRRNMALLLLFGGAGLAAGAGICVLLQLVALLVPFYYADFICGMVAAAGLAAGLAYAVIRRCSMQKAALYADSFGGKERLSTALENKDNPGELAALQRDDAIRYLEGHRERIKVKIFPGWKKAGILLGACAAAIILALIPARTKQLAKEQHELAKEINEAVSEIEQNEALLEEIMESELSEEELAKLQEMIDLLEASATEYQQAGSKQDLKDAANRLDYKYSSISKDLSQMANRQGQLSQNANTQQEKEQAQNAAQKLQQAGEQMAEASRSANGSQNQGTEGEKSEGSDGDGDDDSQKKESQNKGGQAGDGKNQGQGSQGDQGQGSEGDQSQGEGQGQGQGEGQGSGNSSSDGDAGGTGRGTGTTDNTHEYISIPADVGDDEALTGQQGDGAGNDSFYKAQNGIGWEGKHVSYDQVIGEYTSRAYEGLSSGKYPSGMENVIKEYFSSFND